jgi:hypothetical protein
MPLFPRVRHVDGGAPVPPQNVAIGKNASFNASPANASVLLAAIACLVASWSLTAAACSCTFGASSSHWLIFGSNVFNAAMNSSSESVAVAASMLASNAQNAVGFPVGVAVVSSGTVIGEPAAVVAGAVVAPAVVGVPVSPLAVGGGAVVLAAVDAVATDEVTNTGAVVVAPAAVDAVTVAPVAVDELTIDEVTIAGSVDVGLLDEEVVPPTAVVVVTVVVEVPSVLASLPHAPSATSRINGATNEVRRIKFTSGAPLIGNTHRREAGDAGQRARR